MKDMSEPPDDRIVYQRHIYTVSSLTAPQNRLSLPTSCNALGNRSSRSRVIPINCFVYLGRLTTLVLDVVTDGTTCGNDDELL